MQDCGISIALAMEIPQSCTNPSIFEKLKLCILISSHLLVVLMLSWILHLYYCGLFQSLSSCKLHIRSGFPHDVIILRYIDICDYSCLAFYFIRIEGSPTFAHVYQQDILVSSYWYMGWTWITVRRKHVLCGIVHILDVVLYIKTEKDEITKKLKEDKYLFTGLA